MPEPPAARFGAQYEEERRRLTRQRLGTACLLATGILPLYAVTDYLLYPHYFSTLLVVRFIAVLFGLAMLALVRSRAALRSPDALALIIGFAFALAASGIPVFLLGYGVPYYVGFILVIFGMALLLPWQAHYVSALAFGLLAVYVLTSVLHGPIDNWAAFACNTSFIAATIGIGLVSMRTGERLRQREFCARLALQEAYDKQKQLTAVLADKSTELESLNREMKDLLYVASHDLRAPLINVEGFSRELKIALEQVRGHNGKSPELNAALTDIDESLRFILTGVSRMDVLITSLLNISRVVTRTNPTEQVDLDRLVHKLADSVRYQLIEKDIQLEIEDLPVVIGDPVRLGQLFGNLLDNAIKYMGESPQRRIEVGTVADNGEPRFFVRDTGLGIPKEQHEHVFRLFRRLANGDSPGEGIGLTMVRKIVEKHGGRIWLDSAPRAGTTFWFTLRAPSAMAGNGGLK